MAARPETGVPSIEAQTIKKMRFRLLPFLFLLYVICYLDRINVSIAALTMNKDLGITSEQYGLLTGIFFIGYFLFEVPSNLLLHKIGARIWIARILISWGLMATLTGFVQTVHQIYVVRFLLGLAEAGYVPGVYLYLTYWFPKREQARTIAVFLLGLPVSNIVGAPVSGYILDHVHWLGIASWRWLLILEGIPPILLGVLTYFLLPSWPKDATFLTEDEKNWIQAELEREETEKLKQPQLSLIEVFLSGRVWYLIVPYFGIMIAGYTMSFWTPQIIKLLAKGFSNSAVGVLIMIPNLAAAVGMILISRSSDQRLERKFHAGVTTLAAGLAIAVLGGTHYLLLAVTLLCVVEIGLCGFLGPFWAMPSAFLSGAAMATGFALINSIGNLGGFVGPSTVGSIYQRTGSLQYGLLFVSASLTAASVILMSLGRRASASAAEG